MSTPQTTAPQRRESIAVPSILVLVMASVVALYVWPWLRTLGLCDSELHSGTNIGYAVGLALLCGVFGSVALGALRGEPRGLAVALLVAALLLSVCVALVWLDSAAYAVHTPYVPG